MSLEKPNDPENLRRLVGLVSAEWENPTHDQLVANCMVAIAGHLDRIATSLEFIHRIYHANV